MSHFIKINAGRGCDQVCRHSGASGCGGDCWDSKGILSAKKRRSFYESQLGNTLTVLFENENKEGYINGFTENYVKVKSPWNPDLINTLHAITLTEIDEDGLVRFNFIKETISI